MIDTQELIDNFLEHAGARYYDPVKAREYYLKTRELKGRQSGSALKSETKKQAWAYSKAQITDAKKAEQLNARESQAEAVAQLRQTATERRKDLSAELGKILDTLTENRASDTKSVSAQAQRAIDALPPIPKGISADRRAELAAERKEKIAKIRGDASEDRAAISSETATEKKANREGASAIREEIGNELKGSIDTARQNYDKLKQDLVDKYEAEYQSEYDAIKKTVR